MKGPFMEFGHGDVGNGMSDPKPVDDNEFAEFMWMGEELDEFDQQVEQQLMEEFLIETCVEQMLRDEDDDGSIPPDLQHALNVEMMKGLSTNLGGTKPQEDSGLATQMADLTLASRSRLNPNAPVFTLNPNASVFVPRGVPATNAKVSTDEGSSRSTEKTNDIVDPEKIDVAVDDGEKKEKELTSEKSRDEESLEERTGEDATKTL